MKSTLYNLIRLSMVCALCTSCDRDDPLATEQYMKQIYMVGANLGVHSFNVPYSSQPQSAYVAVALGGSLNADHDITVSLAHDNTAIKAYNSKYMLDNAPVKYQRLPESFYNIPSLSGTIKAGDVYGRIPFSVTTQGLHCDSLYALAFNIASVSDYKQNEATPTLILNLKIDNAYSGSYQLEAVKYTVTPANTTTPETAELSEPAPISSTRTVKAVNMETVRFFHEAKAESRSGYDNNDKYWQGLLDFGVTFTKVAGSNNEFTIKSWQEFSKGTIGTLKILTGKANYADGVFSFWYDYMEGAMRRRIVGKLHH
jgi:hypothetical protein